MQFKLLSRHKENIFQTKLIWEVRHSEASSNPRQLDVLWLSRWIMQQGDHFSSTFSSEREEETMMFEARRSSDFTKRDPACDTVPKGQRVWAKPRGGGGGGTLARPSMCNSRFDPPTQPLTGILLYSSSPFVPMALLPTVLDNEWCCKTLLFHTLWVTYNFSWVTFDLRTDSLIYCPVLWFMSIFSE